MKKIVIVAGDIVGDMDCVGVATERERLRLSLKEAEDLVVDLRKAIDQTNSLKVISALIGIESEPT